MTTISQVSQSWGNSPELLTFGLESLLSSQKKILLDSSLFSQTGSKKLFWKMRRKPLISVKRYLQYGTAGIAECQIFLKDKSDLYSPFSLKFFLIPCVSFVPIIDCKFMKKHISLFRANWQACVEILTNILQMIWLHQTTWRWEMHRCLEIAGY